MISDGAKCAQHANVDATNVCTRCGSFMCEPCTRVHDGEPVCTPCEELLLKLPPSMLAIVAGSTMVVSWLLVAASFAGLVQGYEVMGAGVALSAAIAVVAGVLAVIELRRTSTHRGRSIAWKVLLAFALHIVGWLCAFSMMAIGFAQHA